MTTPSYSIYESDVVDYLSKQPSNSFDACLCDPPYGLEFMGKAWDAPWKNSDVSLALRGSTSGLPVGPGSGRGTSPTAGRPGFDLSLSARHGFEQWVTKWAAELYRVLKPGATALVFGGTRMFHRLTCGLEDTGFEIRDCMMWLYGSGFPKSLDVALAIDKAARGVPQGVADPTSVNHGKYKGGCSEENESGQGFGAGPGQFMQEAGAKNTREYGPEASHWNGYRTALKPAWEPIVVAMKPCDEMFAANALKHGVAGLAIDAGRIDCDSRPKREVHSLREDVEYHGSALCGRVDGSLASSKAVGETSLGRWPANVLLDEESAQILDEQSGKKTTTRHMSYKRGGGDFIDGIPSQPEKDWFEAETGGASRFFYCAKASRKERGEGNSHPTVKPVKLCEYLAQLILPPERETPRRLIVPFCGSGTEMIAAGNVGWDEIVGIEKESAYCKIALDRIKQVDTQVCGVAA